MRPQNCRICYGPLTWALGALQTVWRLAMEVSQKPFTRELSYLRSRSFLYFRILGIGLLPIFYSIRFKTRS
jgi:hypothetical protein